MIQAYAAHSPGDKLSLFEYSPQPLEPYEVEIDIDYCGICHSDLSMLNNDWEITQYPFVPGHEVVGRVSTTGEAVAHLKKGDSVGLGWVAQSCMTCHTCLSGDHNLCGKAQPTIVGRYGGFANKVRAHAAWVIKIPEGVDSENAGPLFCGGITVFNPIVQNNISPIARVGVVGIGGLGHLALQFLKAWGCEVTAFSTSPDKEAEAKQMGAHHFVSTHDKDALKKVANTFDMILDTVNVELDWEAYIAALRPKGILHVVGVASKISTSVFPILSGQKSISASPVGSPSTMADMLTFASRHKIQSVNEFFPMSAVNDAMEKLKTGDVHYRIVLKNDFSN